jgi:hypothetical protein
MTNVSMQYSQRYRMGLVPTAAALEEFLKLHLNGVPRID